MQTSISQQVAGQAWPVAHPARQTGKVSGRPGQHATAKAARPSGIVSVAATEQTASNGAVATSVNPLDFDELTNIITMVNETDIVELEMKSKRFSLAVRKKEALPQPERAQSSVNYGPPMGYAPPMYAPAPAPEAPAAPPPASAPAPAAAAPAAAPAKPPPVKVDGLEITAPMSGTLYRSPAPGEPPFCKEGDVVQKGQTICIVEAMKLMNEVEAECAGTITKFLAENGKPIYPGQPLVIIKPL